MTVPHQSELLQEKRLEWTESPSRPWGTSVGPVVSVQASLSGGFLKGRFEGLHSRPIASDSLEQGPGICALFSFSR